MNKIDSNRLQNLLRPRERDVHKGLYGHVLIVGSGLGMPGATALAAHAAFRVGAGSVTVAIHPDYAKQSIPNLPEVMVSGVRGHTDLEPLLSKATVCVLGPGLGEDEWAKRMYQHVLSTSMPLLIDASALRLLGNSPESRDHWILTPHPGEAAALLGWSHQRIQADRVDAITHLQQRYHGTIVLKGQNTLVIDPSLHIAVCDAGNPGMATAGMGDVLSGVIGGLMAQGIAAPEAARLGVWLHASAGDKAAIAHGERGLMARDLFPFIQQLSNPTLPLCP